MPVKPSRSSVQIDISESPQTASAVLDDDAPFRILVIGDFRGEAQPGAREPLASRRPVSIDCDNFDEVMESFNPGLNLPRAVLRFRELDDFHPDHLYRAAPVFEELETLRPSAKATPQPPPGGLLDAIVGESGSSPARAEDAGDLAAFIDRVSRKHLEARPDAAQQEWKVRVRAASCELMNSILHDPRFQSLEAAWRSVSMLITRLGAEEGIEIALLDVSTAEIADTPEAVAQRIAGLKGSWSLIVGNFAFGQGAEDAKRLAALARAAQWVRAPLLAEAQPPDGQESDEWRALRNSPQAAWIGLALPRFLARLPYGRSTSPIESMEYEEMPESVHGDYLWANPAFCCACLIGAAFRAQGWDLRPGAVRRMEGMPLHVYRQNGESVSKPCAEVVLSEAQAEQLLDMGLMPLASLKDQDAVMIVRFCSIANPAAPLSGRWR